MLGLPDRGQTKIKSKKLGTTNFISPLAPMLSLRKISNAAQGDTKPLKGEPRIEAWSRNQTLTKIPPFESVELCRGLAEMSSDKTRIGILSGRCWKSQFCRRKSQTNVVKLATPSLQIQVCPSSPHRGPGGVYSCTEIVSARRQGDSTDTFKGDLAYTNIRQFKKHKKTPLTHSRGTLPTNT